MIVGGVTKRHPADRRDAALRLLRRLVDPGELRPARAAALVSDRARREYAAVNAPIVAPVRASSLLLFAVLVAHVVLQRRVRRRGRCRTTRATSAQLLEQQQIRRGTIRAADGTVLARSLQRAPTGPTRAATRPAGCSPTRSATATSASAAPGLEQQYDNDALDGRAQRVRLAARPAARRRRRDGDDLRTTLDPTRAARRARRRWPGARARSSRSTRARARSRPDRLGSRASTPTRCPRPALQPPELRPATRRCSTA